MKEKIDLYNKEEQLYNYLDDNYIDSSSKSLKYENYGAKDNKCDDILDNKEGFALFENNKELDALFDKAFVINTKYSYKEKISDEDIYIKEETLNKIYFNKKEKVPELYTFDKIKKEIFPKLNIQKEIKEKILPSKNNITNIEKSMSDREKSKSPNKKRKKTGKIKFNNDNKYEKPDDGEERKRGRKKADDYYSKSIHNIYSSDNINKKIKTNLLEFALIFLNTILNLFLDEKKLKNYTKNYLKNRKKKDSYDLIKNLDYTFIKNINKTKEISLLSTPLKDIFSNNISRKYKTYHSNLNKQIINQIIKEESNNPIIMKAFNLTFREWIDIFTYKKDLKTIIEFEEETAENLDGKFDYIDKLILDIYEKYQDTKYLFYFISYIYNYERWFLIKKERNRNYKKVKEK